MTNDLTRRGFLAAGTAVAAGTVAEAGAAESAKGIKIIGISASARKGKTTAAAVAACLEAAKGVAPDRIETELIDLGGLRIDGCVAAGVPLPEGQVDDFLPLVPKLSDPKVAGIIIGSPTYFSNMSSVCKAFLERLMVFRKDNFALANKVAGALAVGAARNGGQELVIRSIHNCLFAQELIIVGESRPSAHFGPCLVNTKDDISKDEAGLGPVKNLGKRVAQVVLLLRGIA